MAHIDHHSRSRIRLAHLGKPVGTPSHDSLLRHLYARRSKRGAGLADESPLYVGRVFRGITGVLASGLCDPERVQLRQRGCGDSALDLHPIRASGLSRVSRMGHPVHGLVRLGLCGIACLGLSACAQWTPGWLEKPKTIAPAPVETITYAAQPRLGGSWQYQQPQPGLVHMIGKRMPAIVDTAMPGPYVPRLSKIPQETMPYPKKKPFQIPQSWFRSREKKAKAAQVNPWHCQPAKLPCGKAGADYWACTKDLKEAKK